MNILLINQFYPPDIAPTGVKLHDLAKYLVSIGHRVTVLSSRGSYNGNKNFKSEILDDVNVIRLKASNLGRATHLGKLLDYLSFFLILLVKLLVLKPRPDIVVALTTPPYLGLVPVAAFSIWYKKDRGQKELLHSNARKRIKIVHWIMDLYPDVINAHGILKKENTIYKLLSFINKKIFMHSNTILALGPSMINRIEAYIERPGEKIIVQQSKVNIFDTFEKNTYGGLNLEWVPLWGDSDLKNLTEYEKQILRSKYGWNSDTLVLMHAGNIGLGVGLDEFMKAADRLGKEGPVWAFFGGGTRWSKVQQFKQEHKDARIELHDYAPKSILCAADVHLVSLVSSWTGVGVPSKLQNIFSIGKPVIFVGSMESEMALWIMESGGGWVVKEGDVEGLLSAIGEAKKSNELIRRGQAAREYAKKYFDQKNNCEVLADIITR